MRLDAAIHGKLHEFMAAEAEAAKAAVTNAVKEVGNNIKQELRAQVESAGLGKGVANAWRLQLFPKGKNSLNAAAYVKTKAQKVFIWRYQQRLRQKEARMESGLTRRIFLNLHSENCALFIALRDFPCW